MKKSNEDLLDEFEAQANQAKIAPNGVSAQADVEAYDNAFQKYNDPMIGDRARINSVNAPDAGISLGGTQVERSVQDMPMVEDRNFIKSYQYQDPKTGKMINADPNEAYREPNAEREPAEQFVGSGRKVQVKSAMPQTLNAKPIPDAKTVPLEVSPIPDGTYTGNVKPAEATSAPEYTPVNFDSAEVQNKARIKESKAIQSEGARQKIEGEVAAKEAEAKALREQSDFYLKESNAEVTDASRLKQLDEDREFWKAQAMKKAPPRGWGERVLDGISVFLGGVGLKGGETNQAFQFVNNKLEQRSKEFIADKNNAVEVLKKLNDLDPRIKKTPENMKRYLRMMQNKGMDKLTEAKIAESKIPATKAKLAELNAKYKKEANDDMNKLYVDISKNKDTQRIKDRQEGMVGAGAGLVFKPEMIKSGTDQERMVYFPDGSGEVMLARDAKTAKAMAENIDAFTTMNRIVQQFENYIKNTPNTQKLLDASGKTRMAGILQSQTNTLVNQLRKMEKTGALQLNEVDFLMKSIPADATSIINQKKMIGQLQEMKKKGWDSYKKALIDAGLVDQKTRQPSGKWSRFK